MTAATDRLSGAVVGARPVCQDDTGLPERGCSSLGIFLTIDLAIDRPVLGIQQQRDRVAQRIMHGRPDVTPCPGRIELLGQMLHRIVPIRVVGQIAGDGAFENRQVRAHDLLLVGALGGILAQARDVDRGGDQHERGREQAAEQNDEPPLVTLAVGAAKRQAPSRLARPVG